jgi:hypothetical protein
MSRSNTSSEERARSAPWWEHELEWRDGPGRVVVRGFAVCCHGLWGDVVVIARSELRRLGRG